MSQEIKNFILLLRELQKIDSEFPLQYAICLLEISLNQGLSMTELSEKTNIPLSTVSRIVGALSKYRQRGTPYNLVEITISPSERRKKQISLTVEGKKFIKSAENLILNLNNRTSPIASNK